MRSSCRRNNANIAAAAMQHIMSAAGVAHTRPYMGNSAPSANISGISTMPLRISASSSDLPPWPVAWKNDTTMYANAENGPPMHSILRKLAPALTDSDPC